MHPEQYPPGRPEFLAAMANMPGSMCRESRIARSFRIRNPGAAAALCIQFSIRLSELPPDLRVGKKAGYADPPTCSLDVGRPSRTDRAVSPISADSLASVLQWHVSLATESSFLTVERFWCLTVAEHRDEAYSSYRRPERRYPPRTRKALFHEPLEMKPRVFSRLTDNCELVYVLLAAHAVIFFRYSLENREHAESRGVAVPYGIGALAHSQDCLQGGEQLR